MITTDRISFSANIPQSLHFENLSDDILIFIFKNLQENDIGACQCTCKHLYTKLKDDYFWKKLFFSRFPEKMTEEVGNDPYDYRHRYGSRVNIVNNLLNGACDFYTLPSGHMGKIGTFVIDSRELFTASPDGMIKRWNLNTDECTKTLLNSKRTMPPPILSIAVYKHRLYSVNAWSNEIQVWDLSSNQPIKTLKGHQQHVYLLFVVENKLFSCSSDVIVKIWDLDTETCIDTLEKLDNSNDSSAIYSFAVYEHKLFYGSTNAEIKIWDLVSKMSLPSLLGHTDHVRCLIIAPNKKLYSGSSDATIMIWDLNTGECCGTLKGHALGVCTLAVYDDILVSGSLDGTVKIWDLNSNQCMATFEEFEGINPAAFAFYEGRLFFSSFSGEKINIVDFTRKKIMN